MNSLLTQEHIDHFNEFGYAIIENVLTDEEITMSRNNLHSTLLNYGINHDNIINHIDEPPNEVRIKSNISNGKIYLKMLF
jgi:hypothetical protein